MKFTIDVKTLRKMVKTVGKKMPGQRKADLNIRVLACSARVFVESNETVAGVESLVFGDGQFTMLYKRFQFILDTYKKQKHLTIEVDDGWMKIGGFSQVVRGYSPLVSPPGKFVVFPVTDLGVLSKDQIPVEANADSAEVASRVHFPDESDQKVSTEWILELLASMAIRLARVLCGRREANPKMLVGLARAIYALDKLPTFTAHIDVAFIATARKKIDGGFEEIECGVQITASGLLAGGKRFTERGKLRTDYRIPGFSVQQSEVKGAVDDCDCAEAFEWMDFADKFMAEIPGAELVVEVYDESDTDCLG